MKKIKIILFIGLLLLLTGCTSEVNIELNESYLTETITIVDKEGTKDEIYKRYRQFEPAYYDQIVTEEVPDRRAEEYTYYNRSTKELNDGYAIIYSKVFDIQEYNKASSFRSTFRSGAVEYSKEDGTINFYTDSNGLLIFDTYPKLSSVKVNITTKLDVLENNADEVRGNTYTWIINRDNPERNIYFKTKNKRYDEIHNIKKKEKKEEEEQQEKEKKKKSSAIYVLIAFLCIIGFLILVFVLYGLTSKLGR